MNCKSCAHFVLSEPKINMGTCSLAVTVVDMASLRTSLSQCDKSQYEYAEQDMAHAVQKLTEATEVLFKSPKQGFKAIVCGGRDYSNKKRVFAALDKVHAKTPIRLLIQGGAKGADLFAKEWAVSRDISHIEMRANWDAFGKAAGHKRNAEMLNYLLSVAGEKNSKPDCGVIAFDGGNGTFNMITQAQKANVTVWQVDEQRGEQ